MAKYQIRTVCTITDPEERKRRLNQVYGLLFDLAREKRLAQRENGDEAQKVTGDAHAN